MTFWICIVLMLLIATLIVLWPLAYGRSSLEGEARSQDVYLLQLEELKQRHADQGTEVAVYEEEKVELSRRLLRANRLENVSTTEVSSGGRANKIASMVAVLGIPILALSFYYNTGSPTLAGKSAREAETVDLQNKSVGEMALIAERHLAKNPDDLKGWTVLANVYGKTNRAADKARALRQIIRIAGPNSQNLTDLAEALTVAGNNIVSAEARRIFDRALSLGPSTKAEFYLAIASEQEGKTQAALLQWIELAKVRKQDTQWQNMIASRIAKLNGVSLDNSLPGPTQEDLEAASELDADDRKAMVFSMVERLETRLSKNPNDIDGWLRLIRSFAVLGRVENAKLAIKTAQEHFEGNAGNQQRINILTKELALGEVKN